MRSALTALALLIVGIAANSDYTRTVSVENKHGHNLGTYSTTGATTKVKSSRQTVSRDDDKISREAESESKS